jgi:RNA polymerase sigma-70 factor, ECF subfamily
VIESSAVREPSVSDLTSLLRAWAGGDREALDCLIPIVSEELRRIARVRMSHERASHTLQPTALVNEAYLRLIDIRQVQWQDRAHFFAASSEIMRRILVDHARAGGYIKRGGGAQHITLDQPLTIRSVREAELLDLDNALTALAKFDGRKAQIAQLRFFGGLNVREIASVLSVSPETVHRDWRISKSWLRRQLGGSAHPPSQ